MSDKLLCDIYKSLKHAEMYLYVDKREGLSRIPEALLNNFGKAAIVTTLVLTPDRRLARAEAPRVLNSIRDKGYYLQLPPGKDESIDAQMRELRARNEKLPGGN